MLDQIHGQTEAVTVLNRVAQGGLSTPLLLLGRSGVGRRASVVAATKQLFHRPEQPWHKVQIDAGCHPDFHIVGDSDSAIGVEVIRDLIQALQSAPVSAQYRVVMLEGADRMSPAAANALLKTLEEPPRWVRFFLLAESLHLVIATIRSRCGLVRYVPLTEEFIFAHLSKLTAHQDKALACARLSRGSLGVALSYLSSGKLAVRDKALATLESVKTKDVAKMFSSVDALESDLALAVDFIESLLYDMLRLSVDSSKALNADVSDRLVALVKDLGPGTVGRLVQGFDAIPRDVSVGSTFGYHVKAWLCGAVR